MHPGIHSSHHFPQPGIGIYHGRLSNGGFVSSCSVLRAVAQPSLQAQVMQQSIKQCCFEKPCSIPEMSSKNLQLGNWGQGFSREGKNSLSGTKEGGFPRRL